MKGNIAGDKTPLGEEDRSIKITLPCVMKK